MPSQLEPEFASAYDAWKALPGPDSNAAFLKTLQPTVDSAIRVHVGQPNPNLTSRARIMALQAARTYDPTVGKLSTHIYSHLRGLKRFAGRQTQPIRVPERALLQRQHLDSAENELRDELGREPTDIELAERAGFGMPRLASLRKIVPTVAQGTLDRAMEGDASVGVDPVGEARNVWQQLVYEDMDPYHQKVMEHALGLNGRRPISNREIAKRLGKSEGAISQAKLRIQKRLDEEQDLSPF